MNVSAAQETKILQTTKMVKIHFFFFLKKKPAGQFFPGLVTRPEI